MFVIEHAFAQPALQIHLTSPSSPDFYTYDVMKWTCAPSRFTNLRFLYFKFDYLKRTYKRGCFINLQNNWLSKSFNNDTSAVQASPITDEKCRSVGSTTGFNLVQNLTIVSESFFGEFYCSGLERIGENTQVVDSLRHKVAIKGFVNKTTILKQVLPTRAHTNPCTQTHAHILTHMCTQQFYKQ